MTTAQVGNGSCSSDPQEPTDPWTYAMVKASVEIKFKKAQCIGDPDRKTLGDDRGGRDPNPQHQARAEIDRSGFRKEQARSGM